LIEDGVVSFADLAAFEQAEVYVLGILLALGSREPRGDAAHDERQRLPGNLRTIKGEVVGPEHDTADDVEEVSEPPLAANPGRVITHAHIKPMRSNHRCSRSCRGK
jgi:hypothetical protein